MLRKNRGLVRAPILVLTKSNSFGCNSSEHDSFGLPFNVVEFLVGQLGMFFQDVHRVAKRIDWGEQINSKRVSVHFGLLIGSSSHYNACI